MNYSKLAVSTLLAAMIAASPTYANDIDPDPCGDGCEDPDRGDNGWGNGPDTTNPGSFSGGTAPSKSTNGGSRNDRNYPSALDRFEGR